MRAVRSDVFREIHQSSRPRDKIGQGQVELGYTFGVLAINLASGRPLTRSSAACSLKPRGWETWTSPSNCCRRLPRRNFGYGVICADLPRESREELHIQFDWIFGPGSRFLRGFGGGRVLSACTEFHDLAEMVDVRYRILRGDPERVAALIPAGQSC
jgi:hypothetical protein